MNLKRLFIVMMLMTLALTVPALARRLSTDPAPSYPDIVKIGSNANVSDGTIVNSVVVIGGSAGIAGEVNEDVVSIGGNVLLKPSARVHRNVVSIGGVVKRESGATVGGEIQEVAVPQSVTAATVLGSKMGPSFMFIASIFLGLVSFIGLLAIGIFAGLVFPKRIGWTSVSIEQHPVKAFLWGLLWIILALPITFLLLFSVIGIPLILAQFVVYGLAIALGYVSVNQVIGKKLLGAFRRYNQPMVTEIIWGIVLLTLVNLVPLIGPLVSAVVCTMGIGSAWLSRFGEM